jgi:hypothetical protein
MALLCPFYFEFKSELSDFASRGRGKIFSLTPLESELLSAVLLFSYFFDINQITTLPCIRVKKEAMKKDISGSRK